MKSDTSEIKWVRLGDHISTYDKVNSDGRKLPVMGLNKDKEMMPTAANMEGISLNKYKLVEKGVFVFITVR